MKDLSQLSLPVNHTKEEKGNPSVPISPRIGYSAPNLPPPLPDMQDINRLFLLADLEALCRLRGFDEWTNWERDRVRAKLSARLPLFKII